MLLAVSLFWGTPAAGQSCSFSVTGVDFGAIDILSGAPADTTATLSISCTGLLLNTVRVCPSIGAGSGGATAAVRRLQGPSASLDFQLYQNAARTIVWGSNYWGLPGTPPTIDIPLGLGGSGSANVTVYARVMGAQAATPAATYTSSFTAADNQFWYGYTFLGIVGCDQIPLLTQLETPTFAAMAIVSDNCHVAAQDLGFGNQGVLAANVDSSGQVSVTCTNGTPYTVALDGGGAAAPPTARKMSKGGETITYGIYRDAARTQPWGDTVGSMGGGTGSGAAQSLVTYGRVPAQGTPSPGTYSDTVVVTVTY